jgi:serine/threonine protein kinase, bacterial
VRLGKYRLDRQIGSGGLGRVYRASNLSAQRTVALKLLPARLSHDHQFQERFLAAVRTAADIDEPHIVPIFDFGTLEDGRLFVETQLVESLDFSAVLAADAPLPLELVRSVVGSVSQALVAAHRRGLCHLDVKPGNVLLHWDQDTGRGDGGDTFVRLTDFGITVAALNSAIPKTLASLGYPAPELRQGGRPDRRTDCFGLGCLTYHMLAGSPPDLANEGCAPIVTIGRPELKPDINNVLARAMSVDPARRYADTRALAEAIRCTFPQTRTARPIDTGTPAAATRHSATHPRGGGSAPPVMSAPGWRGRSSRVRAALTLGVLGLILSGGVVFWAVSRIGTSSAPFTMTVGAARRDPFAIAMSPDGRRAYVTDNGSGRLAVIDLAGRGLVASVPVGDQPHGLVLDPRGQRVYIANSEGFSLGVLDAATDTLKTTIALQFQPDDVGLSPDGRLAYVLGTSAAGSVVSTVDLHTHSVISQTPVGRGPLRLAVTPSGDRVLTPATRDDSVAIIPTATSATPTVSANVLVGSFPLAVAVSPDSRRAYVTNYGSGSVSVIDIAAGAVTTTIPVGVQPAAVVVSPNGRHAYVANFGSNTVSVIDTSTNEVIDTVASGTAPYGLAVTPDGRTVAVVNTNVGTVTLLDRSNDRR